MDETPLPNAPQGIGPYPTPTMLEGAVVHDAEGNVWCLVTFVTGNVIFRIMAPPESLKQMGEQILELGIKGKRTPIRPTLPPNIDLSQYRDKKGEN